MCLVHLVLITDPEDEASLASGTFSRDDAIAAMTAMFDESLVKQLQDAQWKVRSWILHTVSHLFAKPVVKTFYPHRSS